MDFGGRKRDGRNGRYGIDRHHRGRQRFRKPAEFICVGIAPVGRGKGFEFIIQLGVHAHAGGAQPPDKPAQHLFDLPPANLLRLHFDQRVAVLLLPIVAIGHGFFLGNLNRPMQGGVNFRHVQMFCQPASESIEREFGLPCPKWKFAANFNTTPSHPVPAIRALGGVGEGVLLRWGMGKNGGFNARIETIATSPYTRRPWKEGRRCIIPALGFYEWHVNPDRGKQPYYIHVDDQDVLGFAGLWTRSRRDANTVTESCTLITLPANALMAQVDNAKARMPRY